MQRIACRSCDLLQRIPALPAGGKARCVRCGQTLAIRPADPLDAPLALALAAAVALGIAYVTPLMSLTAEGRDATTTLPGGALAMWHAGNGLTALVVGFCAVVAPALYVGLLLVVLVAVRTPPAPPWVGDLMRIVDQLRPWSMNEVLMLGILVALTKIAQLATVVAGPGLYALLAVVLLLPAIMSTFDPREVWNRIRWADGTLPAAANATPDARP